MKFLESGALMPRPKLFLPLSGAKKIWTWTMSVSGEINGLGLIERKANDFWVTEIFILKQKAGPGRATIDPLAFNQYVGECDDPSKIRFQWHSHGDISANFFSREKDINGTIAKWTGEYLVSLVLNKRGEYRCRLDIFEPIYLGFEIPVFIAVPVEKEILDFCRQEIEEKVEPKNPGFLKKIRRLIAEQEGEEPDWNQEDEPISMPLKNFRFTAQEEEENG